MATLTFPNSPTTTRPSGCPPADRSRYALSVTSSTQQSRHGSPQKAFGSAAGAAAAAAGSPPSARAGPARAAAAGAPTAASASRRPTPLPPRGAAEARAAVRVRAAPARRAGRMLQHPGLPGAVRRCVGFRCGSWMLWAPR